MATGLFNKQLILKKNETILIGTKEKPYTEIPPVKDRDPNKWYLYKEVSTQYKSGRWMTPRRVEISKKAKKKYKEKKRKEKKKEREEREKTDEYKNKTTKKNVFSILKENRYKNKYYRRDEYKKHKCEYDKKRRAKPKIKKLRKKQDAEYYLNTYKQKLLCSHCNKTLATKKHYRKHCMSCFSVLFPDEFKEITKEKNYNQTENKVSFWFGEKVPSCAVEKEWAPKKWFERNFRFDFVFHELELIIEIDGAQHYSFEPRIIRHFNKKMSTEKRIERDVCKMKKANEMGYSVVRIIQEDIWHDKNNWENKLLASIKSYDIPINIFICSNNEYEKHQQQLKDA